MAKDVVRKKLETFIHNAMAKELNKRGLPTPKKAKNNYEWKQRLDVLKGEKYPYIAEKSYFNLVGLSLGIEQTTPEFVKYFQERTQAQSKKPKKVKKLLCKKVGKDFYASWEWKAVRYESLKLHGRQCLCCGFTPQPGNPNYLVVDHIKPVSKFPELALDVNNTQVICNDCNMGKSNIHFDDFRA